VDFSSGDSFSRLSGNRLLISISRSSVFCPRIGQGRCPFRVFAVSGVLFFSLSTGSARRRFQISSSLLLTAQWPARLFFAHLVGSHPDFSIPAAASLGRRLRSLSSAFPFRFLHPVVFSVRSVFFLLRPISVHFTPLAWSLPLVCRVLVVGPS
jgi:hypothetical protein